MIQFRWEWQRSPGSSDPVMDATWARWRLDVGEHVLTDLVDLEAGSRREATYSSLWPVAVWLIENWWFHQHEAFREGSSRDRGWLARHCLGQAIRSAALPRLSVYRGGPGMQARWQETTRAAEPFARVLYLSGGSARLLQKQWAGAATHLINGVFERLRDRDVHVQEAAEYWEQWQRLLSATESEARQCASLARLGLDPYDADDADEDTIAVLNDPVASWPAVLADDFLDAGPAAGLREAAAWVDAFQRSLGAEPLAASAEFGAPRFVPDQPARHGYQLARKMRARVGMAKEKPIADLEAWLVDALRLSNFLVEDLAARNSGAILGAVGREPESGTPHLAPGSQTLGPFAKRFLTCRGLYAVEAQEPTTRLLTSAKLPFQQASRGFAAELLAPAAGLAHLLGPAPSYSDKVGAAAHYGVDVDVIHYQWRNQAQHLVA